MVADDIEFISEKKDLQTNSGQVDSWDEKIVSCIQISSEEFH